MSNPQFNEFRKALRSQGSGNCVEVADAVDGSAAQVRDSKDRSGPVLSFDGAGWNAFIAGAKAGTFNA